MSDQTYYEDLWRKKGGELKYDPEIIKKTEIIKQRIPNDVQTILDVGCGDGSITNPLGEKWEVSAIDISTEAVKHLTPQIRGYLGSSSAMPFNDVSFDLVFTSELLEHLPDSIFENTISELKRVTKKYIFISVPNNEKLRRRFTRCYNCKTEYHLYLHYRSFNAHTLKELFSEFEVIDQTECGVMETPSSNLISLIKNKIGSIYAFVDSVDLICPHCSSVLIVQKRNILQKAFNFALNQFQKGLFLILMIRPKPDWLLVLLQKKEN